MVKTTLEKEPVDVQQSLRVLYTTPPLSPHPLAVHPRVSAGVRTTIIETLLALAENPQTRELMAAIQMPNPVRAIYKRDYAPLEKINIKKYVQAE